jgi:phage baseplate assembly protein W
MSIGLTMPLARSTGSVGYLASTDTDIQATYHNLKALLLTNWGERPNHFYMGCNLGEFLFAQQSAETRELIVQRIETQVGDFLPYVVLNNIDVSFNQDHRIVIKISFSIKDRINLNSILEVAVFPSGG